MTEVSGVIPPKLECEALAEETHNPQLPPPVLPIGLSEDFETSTEREICIVYTLNSPTPPAAK